MTPSAVPMRSRLTHFAVLATLVALLGAAVLPLAAQPAHAITSGSITNISVSPQTLTENQQNQLTFDWAFPDGTTIGDTVTLNVPAEFTIQNPLPFDMPIGQTPALARVSFSGQQITVTRLVGTSYSDISSGTQPASVALLWNQPIVDAQLYSTDWAVTGNPSGTVNIVLTGAAWQAMYYARKEGYFYYDAQTGDPMIRWIVRSPIGARAAGELVTDTLGPDQEMLCPSFTDIPQDEYGMNVATMRWWDQSSAQDAWAGWFSFQGTGTAAPSSCGSTGWAGTTAATIPAPQPGSDAIRFPDPATRPDRVAFALLQYDVKVTAIPANRTWTNVTNWGGVTLHGTVTLPNGGATGNRPLVISKATTGDTAQAAGKHFEIAVNCTIGGTQASGYPQTVSLAGGESTRLIAPTDSVCSASESNAQGATATASAPVTISRQPEDTFSLTVTNNYAPVPPAQVQPAAPTLVPATVCGVEATVQLPTTVGIAYAQRRDANTVTVTATAEPGFVLAQGSTSSWSYDISPHMCPLTPGTTPPPVVSPETPTQPDPAAAPRVSSTLSVTGGDQSLAPLLWTASAAPLVTGLGTIGAHRLARRRLGA